VCTKIETNQVLGHENLQFITKRVKVEEKKRTLKERVQIQTKKKISRTKNSCLARKYQKCMIERERKKRER
jgi:hypothetical protein